jgi:hypothetical protein
VGRLEVQVAPARRFETRIGVENVERCVVGGLPLLKETVARFGFASPRLIDSFVARLVQTNYLELRQQPGDMLTDDDGEGGHPPRIGAELGGKHAGFVDLGMFRDEDAARRGKVGMGQDLLGGRVFDLSDPPLLHLRAFVSRNCISQDSPRPCLR